MVEQRPGFIKRHTPKGRYEEYQAKHAHLVAQTQGEARYLFEKKLDLDAKRYARNRVARDILVTAVLAAGAAFVVREIRNETLVVTFTSLPRKIRELSLQIKETAAARANGLLEHVGSRIAEGAVGNLEAHLPTMLGIIGNEAPAIGQAAAKGMLSEVSQSLPTITDALQERLEGAGVVIAANIMATIESGLPHMAETFAASLRSIPGMVFFGKGKK